MVEHKIILLACNLRNAMHIYAWCMQYYVRLVLSQSLLIGRNNKGRRREGARSLADLLGWLLVAGAW